MWRQAVAAEVEATAEAGRLFAPSQTQDGPKPLPVAGALPDLGVPVAGIGTMGMDKETAAVALARAAQACKGSSEGRAAWGQERVLERGSMESTEAVLLCSALLQSRAEAWRAGEGGREEQIRCTGDAAGEAGVKKGKGGRGQEPRMGGGRRGQEGPSMGPSAGAVDADAAEPLPGLPREVGDGEPAFRWLPPLDAKGGGRRNKKRPREGTGRKEKRPREGTGRADAGDQRGGRRKAGRAAVQDATRGSAGEGGREPNESSLPGPGRAPLPGPGSKLSFGRTGEGAEKWEGAEDWEGEQAWQEVRGVCDEGAVLAWRLVGQQLLRRAQKAGCQAPSLVAALQGDCRGLVPLFVFWRASDSVGISAVPAPPSPALCILGAGIVCVPLSPCCVAERHCKRRLHVFQHAPSSSPCGCASQARGRRPAPARPSSRLQSPGVLLCLWAGPGWVSSSRSFWRWLLTSRQGQAPAWLPVVSLQMQPESLCTHLCRHPGR